MLHHIISYYNKQTNKQNVLTRLDAGLPTGTGSGCLQVAGGMEQKLSVASPAAKKSRRRPADLRRFYGQLSEAHK